MEYGLKVAQPGENVLTASDNKLSFKSSILTMPIYTMPGFDVSSSPYIYTHNLGYAPKTWIFYDDPSNLYFVRVPFEKLSGLSVGSIDYEIDDTTITIRVSANLLPARIKLIIFTRGITDQ